LRGNESQNEHDEIKGNQNGLSESSAPYALTADSYAVTSTDSAARLIAGHGNYFSHLRSGTIMGIPAILLNEGALTNLDVIVFLVNVIPAIPDFRAAAAVSEAVSKIVPNLSCDIGSLMVEAQLIETRMKKVRDERRKTSYIA
jgi:predicted ATP-grasp superfamily ATP-dependent carboligase